MIMDQLQAKRFHDLRREKTSVFGVAFGVAAVVATALADTPKSWPAHSVIGDSLRAICVTKMGRHPTRGIEGSSGDDE